MASLDLSGSTAIVTGAGRGIGAVIAPTLAEAGANIVAAARTRSEIEATADRIEADYGVETLAVQTDLKEVDDIETLVETTVSTLGTPDILVNNAAENLPNRPAEQTLREVELMLQTNLRAVFLLSVEFAEAHREAGLDSGRIVNISSLTGQVGVPAMTLYSGTNAGVYGLTRGLAAEYAPEITVNSVTPGLIGIERIQNLVEERGDEIYHLDRIPLGRLGDPEDIADAVLFLASNRADYITGEDLRVDGGVGFTAALYK